MAGAVSREQLQRLANSKLTDAVTLFEQGSWSNAYYLGGYSIEFALKACAARQFTSDAIPDRKFVTSLYTHQIGELVGLAGLRAELRKRQDEDSTFSAYWGIVAEWSPEVRYDIIDKSTAHYLVTAIADPKHGVLEWIRQFW